MNLKNLSQMPYYKTPASVEKSEAEIKRLLKKYGVNHIRWTDVEEQSLLEFIYQPDQSKPKIRVSIPIPEVKALYKGKKITVPLKQRMRMLVTFLKSLLEASHFGLMSFEQVFYGFIQIQLPSGDSIPTIELVNRYQNGTLLLESGKEE